MTAVLSFLSYLFVLIGVLSTLEKPRLWRKRRLLFATTALLATLGLLLGSWIVSLVAICQSIYACYAGHRHYLERAAR